MTVKAALLNIKSDRRKTILIFAAGAIFVSSLFPPWLHTFYQTGTRDSYGARSEHNAGYHLILAPPSPEYEGATVAGVKLDTERLLVEWVCILAAAGAVWGVASILQSKKAVTPAPMPANRARITGNPEAGYTIEYAGQSELGFESLAEARLAADQIERGQRQIGKSNGGSG